MELYLKKTPTQVFSWEFAKFFKNTSFCRTPPAAASRNGKSFHHLFITMIWLNSLCFINNDLLVLLFNLHTENKILTFVNTNGRPDMLTRKVLNEKFI